MCLQAVVSRVHMKGIVNMKHSDLRRFTYSQLSLFREAELSLDKFDLIQAKIDSGESISDESKEILKQLCDRTIATYNSNFKVKPKLDSKITTLNSFITLATSLLQFAKECGIYDVVKNGLKLFLDSIS